MPYNPQTSYNGAQYLFQGITAGADAVASGMQQYNQNRQKNDFLTQQGRDMANVTDPNTGQPIMTAEMLNKLETGSMSQKQAVVTDALFNLQNAYKQGEAQRDQAQVGQGQQRVNLDMLKQFQDNQSRQEEMTLEKLQQAQQAQYQTGELQIRKEDLDRMSKQFQPEAFKLTDPATGKPIGMVSTSRESAVPLSRGQPAPSEGPVTSPDGKFVWNGKEWKQVTPAKTGSGGGQQDQRNLRVQAIDLEMAKLQADAAKAGKDLTDKTGWFGPTYQSQLDVLQKERESLVGAMEGEGASGESKVLDADTAKQFLEQAGGDPDKARQMAKAAGYTW